jgi:hypothetical protein
VGSLGRACDQATGAAATALRARQAPQIRCPMARRCPMLTTSMWSACLCSFQYSVTPSSLPLNVGRTSHPSCRHLLLLLGPDSPASTAGRCRCRDRQCRRTQAAPSSSSNDVIYYIGVLGPLGRRESSELRAACGVAARRAPSQQSALYLQGTTPAAKCRCMPADAPPSSPVRVDLVCPRVASHLACWCVV